MFFTNTPITKEILPEYIPPELVHSNKCVAVHHNIFSIGKCILKLCLKNEDLSTIEVPHIEEYFKGTVYSKDLKKFLKKVVADKANRLEINQLLNDTIFKTALPVYKRVNEISQEALSENIEEFYLMNPKYVILRENEFVNELTNHLMENTNADFYKGEMNNYG